MTTWSRLCCLTNQGWEIGLPTWTHMHMTGTNKTCFLERFWDHKGYESIDQRQVNFLTLLVGPALPKPKWSNRILQNTLPMTMCKAKLHTDHGQDSSSKQIQEQKDSLFSNPSVSSALWDCIIPWIKNPPQPINQLSLTASLAGAQDDKLDTQGMKYSCIHVRRYTRRTAFKTDVCTRMTA